ncbi:MAG: SRPBCC domain-containing protein [Flavobacteriaceae bacterium]|nr:SRPBCC domain-containing protein [Flavobacteriaceae bacterium]
MKIKVKISAIINADTKKVWDYYTNPEHIVNWNFADPSWHCPTASNNMKIGGEYKARMEAKDGSFGFDFEAIYTKLVVGKEFTYEFGGRTANVNFNNLNNQTEITVVFEPEEENPVEMQKEGWKAILNNFKLYTENN